MRVIAYAPDCFFEESAGKFDAGSGDLMCPTCGCCSLVRMAKVFPSIFEQAAYLSRGVDWQPDEADMGWVCEQGCSQTQAHPK
jgi:hypothetical protein